MAQQHLEHSRRLLLPQSMDVGAHGGYSKEFQEQEIIQSPQIHEVLFPLPSEKMPLETQFKVHVVSGRIIDTLADFLGMQGIEIRAFQDFLMHLNDQNVGRKNRSESYKETLVKVIRPQMKALQEMLQSSLHPSEWRVRMSGMMPLVGAMNNLTIESQNGRKIVIRLYEQGFEIKCPAFELSWNMFGVFRSDEEEGDPFSKPPIYINCLLNPILSAEIDIPPVICLRSDAEKSADGMLSVWYTDNTRRGRKASLGEFISPMSSFTSQGAYNNEGILQYIKISLIVDELPGDHRTERTVQFIYDLREGVPNGELFPERARLMRDQVLLDLPNRPEIPVPSVVSENGVVSISWGEHKESIPVEFYTPTEVSEQIALLVQSQLPPKEQLPRLA